MIPADATRFRVSDPDLAYTLVGAGARLVDGDPDVDIGPVEALGGEAPVVIAQVDGRLDASLTRSLQVARRVAVSSAVRARTVEARRALRRRGYRHVIAMLWDRDQVVRVPYFAPPDRLSIAERFPRRVLLVGSHRPLGETALERAMAEAADQMGRPVAPTWPIPRAATLVLLSDAGVIRVGLGPGGDRIDKEKAALAALAAADPPRLVAQRAPSLLADGRAGLVRWSLEQLLPGSPAPLALDRSLLAECLDFLVALHRLDSAGRAVTATSHADVVAGVLDAQDGHALRAAARGFDEELADAPRGFAHGDFCTTNLLVAGGRLAGVFDWDGAGGPRLPFLDLLHLHLLATSRASVYEWGPAVVDHLLSDARRGGGDLAAEYFRRLGMAPTAGQLRAFAGAYWLEQVAYQLGAYLDRRRDDRWIERSVRQVLRAVAPASRSPRPA